MSAKLTPLGNGVEGLFLKNSRFSTTLISFNFYMPLEREKVAARSLLPFLLTTCSKKYTDFSKLNYKLSKLYGATLEASAEKAGDLQLLKISISVINDKYALDNEPLTEQACELLMRLIFEPKIENGAFAEEDVAREKRKAIEHIRGEISEKRLYAKKRLVEEMYVEDVYGTPKCGTEQEVAALTGEDLYNTWQEVLSRAAIRVNVISSGLPSGLFAGISDRFAALDRHDITDCSAHTPTAPANEIKRVTERMDVAQGKLAMGFSSEMYGTDEDTAPLFVMCDVFGGGPYSRLFGNVREKMSLCYYCSSSSVRIKGLLTVDSGVEEQNAEKAEKEILNQLDIIKRGEFTDFEFESSIKGITDSMQSVDDSQASLDTWFSVKIANRELLTPAEFAERIAAVTREQVIEAAKGIKLHTVYRLLPKKSQ